MLKEQIASGLENALSQQGFVEPSVSDLQNASGVSLRTLYRHFPSKEAMVIGALEHRHARYLDFLADCAPLPGVNAITDLFERLAGWMETEAPHGCMSMSAFAAFPGNARIDESVKGHKSEIRQLLATQSGREDRANELFLLHEGVSMAWPTQGSKAIQAAQKAALYLLKE
jgi:AcrR family transcriptional regulator